MLRKILLSFALSRVALYTSTAADLASTRIAINRGAVETNPLLGQNMARQIAISGAITVLSDLTTRRLHKEHPKLAVPLNWAATSVHTGAAVSNLRLK